MRAPVSNSNRPALAGLHVLLVEDDQDVREAVEALLLLEGAEVIACAAAEPAIAILAGPADIGVLVSDVVLGGALSGFDVAAAAMAHRPQLPILLATGYAGTAICDLPRPVPILLKPFRHTELLAMILRLIRTAPESIHAAA